jgi:hypothetical protein
VCFILMRINDQDSRVESTLTAETRNELFSSK